MEPESHQKSQRKAPGKYRNNALDIFQVSIGRVEKGLGIFHSPSIGMSCKKESVRNEVFILTCFADFVKPGLSTGFRYQNEYAKNGDGYFSPI